MENENFWKLTKAIAVAYNSLSANKYDNIDGISLQELCGALKHLCKCYATFQLKCQKYAIKAQQEILEKRYENDNWTDDYALTAAVRLADEYHNEIKKIKEKIERYAIEPFTIYFSREDEKGHPIKLMMVSDKFLPETKALELAKEHEIKGKGGFTAQDMVAIEYFSDIDGVSFKEDLVKNSKMIKIYEDLNLSFSYALYYNEELLQYFVATPLI